MGASTMLCVLIGLRYTGFAIVSVMRAAGINAVSLIFDHVGCLGAPVRRVSRRRVLGLLLLLAGSTCSVADELVLDLQARGPHELIVTAAAAALPLIGGCLLPLQAVVNGALAKNLGAPLRATLVSFIGGCSMLILAVSMCGTPLGALDALGHAPWWAFTGGALGLLQVTSNMVLPQFIGYATVGGFSLCGTLSSSLALDATSAFGFEHRAPTLARCGGAVLALAGAIVMRQSASKPGGAGKPLLQETPHSSSSSTRAHTTEPEAAPTGVEGGSARGGPLVDGTGADGAGADASGADVAGGSCDVHGGAPRRP